MARIVENKIYLLPHEASAMLNVSYKTLERWAELKRRTIWAGTVGSRRRKHKPVKLDLMKVKGGRRYYEMNSIRRLARQLDAQA